MPLIDLQTNLRSLKYGADRPGGASSKQPFVTTDIPGPDRAVPYSAANDNSDYEGNSPDFILRNGLLNVQDSLQDVARITKWFATPSGLSFIIKQNLLERQNVPIPGGSVLNRLYLPTSTIAQAGVLSIGYHLNKKGLNPFVKGYAIEGESAEGYFKFTTAADSINEGRLALLYKVKNNLPYEKSIAELYNISTDQNILFSYNGGPNSPIPGLGKTNIRFAGSGPRNRVEKTTEQIAQVYPVKNSTILSALNTDYNKGINEFNREKTYGTSNTNWDYKSNTDPFDLQNILNVISNPTPENKNNDLIKFFFEVVDPRSNNNTTNQFLFFRAYVNSIGDNFKAEWTPYKYVGRAENFYKYGGFGRDVQLSFTIYAHTEQEMIPLYNKLNGLLGTTAPRYSGAGLMLGNFVRITIGDYFNNMPSIINSINLKPSFEAGWEINRKDNGTIIQQNEGAIGQIPKMIEVDLGFTPLHNFVPQYGENFVRTLDATPAASSQTVPDVVTPSPPLPSSNFDNQFDIPLQPRPSGPSITEPPVGPAQTFEFPTA